MAHEYSTALEEFRAAYGLSREPRLLINIGRCLYRLNRAKEAQEQLRRFLQSEPNPDPEDQEKVNQYLAEAQAAIAAEQSRANARVTISGAPDGAHIFADGTERGVAPLRGPLELSPGPHDLVIRGAEAVTRHLELSPGQDVAVVLAASDQVKGRRPAWRIGVGAAGLALGAAVVGTGAYLLSLNGQCAPGTAPMTCGTGFDPQGHLLVQTYDTAGAGGAMVALGAAAAIGGIVLLALPAPHPPATVAAMMLPGGGLVSMMGSF